ncbi:hypothetical protein KCU71_g113, partial [Aureobasidium melanogenum]
LPRREGPKPESHSKRHSVLWRLEENSQRHKYVLVLTKGVQIGARKWEPRDKPMHSASIGTCLDLSQIDSLRLIVDEGRRVTLLDGKRGAVIVRRSFDRSQRTINKPSLIVHHPRQISYLQRSLAHLLDCYIRLCAFNHD